MVVLDNGRSQILGTKFQEALHCIRCGACLNVCPVYRQVGGHVRLGVRRADRRGADAAAAPRRPRGPELAEASTLCGACWEACPVRIPLHDLLLELRQRRRRRWRMGAEDGIRCWSWAWSSRTGSR